MFIVCHYFQMFRLIEQGLTSHQTHYRSYWACVFTGQMTQPTVSKHWRKIGPKD